jgi:hypothetical protein
MFYCFIRFLADDGNQNRIGRGNKEELPALARRGPCWHTWRAGVARDGGGPRGKAECFGHPPYVSKRSGGRRARMKLALPFDVRGGRARVKRWGDASDVKMFIFEQKCSFLNFCFDAVLKRWDIAAVKSGCKVSEMW